MKINAFDREDRSALGTALTEACGAEVVQKIGKVLVLFRQNPDAKPGLSNLTRQG